MEGRDVGKKRGATENFAHMEHDEESFTSSAKKSRAVDYMHLLDEICEIMNPAHRLEILTHSAETWFNHDEQSVHDEEALAEVPSTLCLLLGYAFSMESASKFTNMTSFVENDTEAMSTTQDLTFCKLCQSLNLIYGGCSNYARNESFRLIGAEAVALVTAAIVRGSRKKSHAGRGGRGAEKNRCHDETTYHAVNVLFSFAFLERGRGVMGNDDAALAALVGAASADDTREDTRLVAICALIRIGYAEGEGTWEMRFFLLPLVNFGGREESGEVRSRQYAASALVNVICAKADRNMTPNLQMGRTLRGLSNRILHDVLNLLHRASANRMWTVMASNDILETLSRACWDSHDGNIRRRAVLLLRCLAYGNAELHIKDKHNILVSIMELATNDIDYDCRVMATECLSCVASGLNLITDSPTENANEHVLEALVRVSCNEGNREAQRKAMRGICYLSRGPLVVSLAMRPYILDALLKITQESGRDNGGEGASLFAVEAIISIATAMTDTLQNIQKVLGVLMILLSHGIAKCVEKAAGALLEYSRNPENRITMANHNGLLKVIANVASCENSTIITREYATGTLCHLAGESANGEKMLIPEVMTSLVKVASLNWRSNDTARADSVMAIVYLCALVPNRRLMANQVGLLSSLIRYSRSITNDEMKDTVKDVIRKLVPVM